MSIFSESINYRNAINFLEIFKYVSNRLLPIYFFCQTHLTIIFLIFRLSGFSAEVTPCIYKYIIHTFCVYNKNIYIHYVYL